MSKKKHTIVILGGGFAGMYAYRRLYRYFHGSREVSITIVSKNNYFLFTPLLHEVATGSLAEDHIIESIFSAIECCDNRLLVDNILGVDLARREVILEKNRLKYDFLVVALGAKTNFFGVKGAEEYAIGLKDISDAKKIKTFMTKSFSEAQMMKGKEAIRKKLTFTVVGGGPTGVELVAEMQELINTTYRAYFGEKLVNEAQVTLIHRGKELLERFHPEIRKKALQVLRKKGIKVNLQKEVVEVKADEIVFTDKESIPSALTVWAAGVTPVSIAFSPEIKKEKDNRLIVRSTLAAWDYPEVFVAGDMMSMWDERGTSQPIPQTAQAAVLEGELAGENVYRIIKGRELQIFRYQSKGALVSLGQWMAAGEIHSVPFFGHFAWWLWRTVYLTKMISFKKKILVALDWTANLFSPRDISDITTLNKRGSLKKKVRGK